jgi:hypothetical protein
VADSPADGGELHGILATLELFGTVLAIKLYRLTLDAPAAVPTLPCLDHEAQLHEAVAPHLSAYIRESSSGDIHELAFTPSKRRIDIDTTSTIGEYSDESHARLRAMLATHFPSYQVEVQGPSRWHGERRVAAACRAQVTLRDVLVGTDLAKIERRLQRLQVISALMEKQSRVTSWAVRTVTGPALAFVGFLAYELLGSSTAELGAEMVAQLQYAVVGIIGAAFLYFGLKAVQLTDMSTRIWKRSTEYSLILSGRRRLDAVAPLPSPPADGAPPTR